MSVVHTNNTTNSPYRDVPLVVHVIYAVIGSIAIIGNLLVCIVTVHSKTMMKSAPHNLIFSLAVVDMFTGIIVVITPAFVYPTQTFAYPVDDVTGPLFCKLIDSEYFFFVFGFTSIYIILTISIERWCAIAWPWRYQRIFSVRNCRIMVICIFILQSLLTLENILNMHYNPSGTPPCNWSSGFNNNNERNTFFIIMETIRLFIPVTIIAICYLDIARRLLYVVKISSAETPNKVAARKRVTVMAFTASMLLIICWLPNELYFTAYQFGGISLNELTHKIFKALIVFNSSLNPFIYAVTNEVYRQGLMKLILPCRKLCKRKKKINILVPRPRIM